MLCHCGHIALSHHALSCLIVCAEIADRIQRDAACQVATASSDAPVQAAHTDETAFGARIDWRRAVCADAVAFMQFSLHLHRAVLIALCLTRAASSEAVIAEPAPVLAPAPTSLLGSDSGSSAARAQHHQPSTLPETTAAAIAEVLQVEPVGAGVLVGTPFEHGTVRLLLRHLSRMHNTHILALLLSRLLEEHPETFQRVMTGLFHGGALVGARGLLQRGTQCRQGLGLLGDAGLDLVLTDDVPGGRQRQRRAA